MGAAADDGRSADGDGRARVIGGRGDLRLLDAGAHTHHVLIDLRVESIDVRGTDRQGCKRCVIRQVLSLRRGWPYKQQKDGADGQHRQGTTSRLTWNAPPSEHFG